MTAANVERGDIIRKRRCGGLSGDVARRTVELLNAHFGFAELPVASPVAEEETLAPNEYIGEARSPSAGIAEGEGDHGRRQDCQD